MTKHLPSPAFMALGALAFAVLFLAFPELDRLASGALYQAGRGFALRGNAVFDFVHDYVGIVAWLGALAALSVALAGRWLRPLTPWRRPAAFVLLVLLLGPGLMVNAVLKDHWGRARPAQTVEFGGKAQFSPAWVVSDQCPNNCSFVCGDASIGFSLVAMAFIARRPRPWLAAGIGLGAALGLMRMAQGGHFLSDVVFSFYAVWFTAWGLNWLMVRLGKPPSLSA
ncbi:MAG: phosphatase PAP2 family protein [Gallionellaceae bacterium]|nr:phosphatase PAP2 family protein [Gallionellaceae bacterium]MDD5364925.1 phosphatase PAP2 family protein [Gallionellaceae bacterium]